MCLLFLPSKVNNINYFSISIIQCMKHDMLIEDETGKKMEAQTIFAKSIKYLKRHFQENLDNQGMEIQDSEILYVLTVPAIWNDSAKQFMRNAAVQVCYI